MMIDDDPGAPVSIASGGNVHAALELPDGAPAWASLRHAPQVPRARRVHRTPPGWRCPGEGRADHH